MEFRQIFQSFAETIAQSSAHLSTCVQYACTLRANASACLAKSLQWQKGFLKYSCCVWGVGPTDGLSDTCSFLPAQRMQSWLTFSSLSPLLGIFTEFWSFLGDVCSCCPRAGVGVGISDTDLCLCNIHKVLDSCLENRCHLEGSFTGQIVFQKSKWGVLHALHEALAIDPLSCVIERRGSTMLVDRLLEGSASVSIGHWAKTHSRWLWEGVTDSGKSASPGWKNTGFLWGTLPLSSGSCLHQRHADGFWPGQIP
ncbi:hypothetical protein EYD10_14883 [Varanus komodoensis]|nr:hypothetical protein EYD10_14883 [Varanus komodoensis]